MVDFEFGVRGAVVELDDCVVTAGTRDVDDRPSDTSETVEESASFAVSGVGCAAAARPALEATRPTISSTMPSRLVI